MTLEEAKALEEWLLRVWRDSPDRPDFKLMSNMLKLLRNNAGRP